MSQKIPFPAVTIGTTRDDYGTSFATDSYRFYQELLEQLEYDCSDKSGDPAGACLDRSGPLRRVLAPVARHLITDVLTASLNTAKNAASDSGSGSGDEATFSYFVARGACFHVWSFTYFGLPLVPFLESLQEEENLEELLDLLVDNFRMPSETVRSEVRSLSARRHNLTAPQPFTLETCQTVLANLSFGARAALLTLIELHDTSFFPFGTGTFLDEGNLGQAAFVRLYGEEAEELTRDLEASAGVLTAGGSVGFGDIADYLLDYDFSGRHDSCKSGSSCADGARDGGKTCCQLEGNISASYAQVLRVMKYSQPPTGLRVRERADLREIREGRRKSLAGYTEKEAAPADDGGGGVGGPERHVRPVVIACSFGRNRDPDADCPHFARTFNTGGIGYTFNADPFWSVYRDAEWARKFYEEIHEQVEEEVSKPVEYPDYNGPNFALTVLVDTVTPNGVRAMADGGRSRPVAVHNPSDLPDLSGDVLSVRGGTRYSVQVTPEVLESEDGVEDLDRGERKCSSRDEVHEAF